jgi:hypothetical protein
MEGLTRESSFLKYEKYRLETECLKISGSYDLMLIAGIIQNSAMIRINNSLAKVLYGYCLILSSALLGLGYLEHIANVSSKLTDRDSGKISQVRLN